MKVATPLIEPVAAWADDFLARQFADQLPISSFAAGSSDRPLSISDGGARSVPPVLGDGNVASSPLPSGGSTNFDEPVRDDADGVAPQIEARCPNGGDGNGDGFRDALQPDVTSLRVSGRSSFVTVEALGHTLTNVRALPAPAASAATNKLPLGMFAFEVHGVARGGAADVRLFLPEGSAANAYFKQDSTGTLQRFDFDGTTGATFDGNVVTLHLVDGDRGDADGVANGVIVDPGGPGGAPTANYDSYTVAHDRPLVIYPEGLLANDTNPDGVEVTVVMVAGPTNGSVNYASLDLSITGVGAFQYTPNPLFVGTDSFTYKLAYGEYESNTATVSIAVTNAAPTASPNAYSILEDQRLTVYAQEGLIGAGGSGIDDTTPFSAGMFTAEPVGGWYGVSNYDSLLENDTDVDADVLRAVLVTDVTNGKLAFYDDGSFVYTPKENFVGEDSFTYRTTDGIADSSSVTAKINVNYGAIADLDGRDKTTGLRWMTEGEERAYGLGVSTISTGDVLARAPRTPTADPGWILTERKVFFDHKTLTVGGSSSGVIDLLGASGDVVLSVAALHDITTASQLGLSSIDYLAGWTHPILMGVQSFVTVPVRPKVVWEKFDVTSDHKVLLNNTREARSVKDAERFPDIEVDFTKNQIIPFSQTIDTQFKHTLTYSTAGIPAGATLTGKVDDAGNPAAFPWASTTFALQANVSGSTVAVPLGNIPIHTMGRFRLELKYTATMRLLDNSTQESTAHITKYSMFTTYGIPRNPGLTDVLKPTEARMRIASPVLTKAYNTAVVKRAAIVPAQAGIPKPEQIVFETLNQHVFALSNAIVGDHPTDPSYGWYVSYYWTNKYPSKRYAPANYVVGGDCISGAYFTKFANYIYGVPGTINNKEYASKSTTEPTKSAEWATVKGNFARGTPVPNADGNRRILTMWDSASQPNSFESTIVWSDPTKTYYFPSGIAKPNDTPPKLAPVYTQADDVLFLFSSFGWGKWVPDATRHDGGAWVLVPNVKNGAGDVEVRYQWLTDPRPPAPTEANLYQ